ncbi:MAG: PQQ-like beta-propeller repeat protein [Bryobacteraceae bacterium]|nr:PQQ-like beta-propeller repeat protein [Bryobacteraceae bacterium]
MVRRLAVSMIALSPMAAAQWPQWRGPTRDGAAPTRTQARPWPSQLSKLWERDVGHGHSGPIADSSRVWVHTRNGANETVACLRLDTGARLWSASYPAPFEQDSSAAAHGCGPFSTPAFSGNRLFTISVDGVLSAWDADSGRFLWRRASGGEFGAAYPYFGAAASPLVWRDLVFTHIGGHRRGKMETPGAGAFVALRVSDGREQWRWAHDGPAMGASPVLCEIQGRTQLIFKSKKNMAGLDPATGRELWRIPYQVAMDNTIATPLCIADRVITSDYDAGLMSWRVERTGQTWTARPSWRHRDASLFMNSPVLAAGFVAGFSHFRKGQLFLLNPHDGKIVWRGDGRSGEHASLISRGSELLVFLDDGTLLAGVIEREAFRMTRRYRLGEANTYAHPALAGDLLLYKTGSRLAAWR